MSYPIESDADHPRNYTEVRYRAQGRNGYTAIDEYHGDGCMRNIDAFTSAKIANNVTMELNIAYTHGKRGAAQEIAQLLRKRGRTGVLATIEAWLTANGIDLEEVDV